LKVAALYDVHGMPHALAPVLDEITREEVDAIVFGGDVFLGPLPAETLELVRSVDAQYVRGNCEREPGDWVLEKLNPADVEWGRSWPTTVELDGVVYCHATPQSDEPILTDASPDERFEQALAGVDARLVVAGHTHMQFHRGNFVNAGSVGMPYEDDVAAFWLVVRDQVPGGDLVPVFKRTPFDVERAIADIEASGWPGANEFVAQNLRAPPSRREATDYFESLA
jgi:predicted phosphodiesterase